MKKVLNFIFGALIILIVQYLSLFILRRLNIPIPTPVLGIIVLFILLKAGIVKERYISDFCNFILRYMVLFFIPMFVGVICYADIITENFYAIILTIFTTTTIVMVSVGLYSENMIKFKRLHTLKQREK